MSARDVKAVLVLTSFNEELNISSTLQDVLEVFKGWPHGQLGIFLVDDGSNDYTWERFQDQKIQMKKSSQPVVKLDGIRLPVNSGKSVAQMVGLFSNKDFDYVLFMDSDGQHAPHDAREVLEKAIRTQKSVVGVRGKYRRGLASSVGVTLISFVLFILGSKFNRQESELLVIPKPVAQLMLSHPLFGASPVVALLRAVNAEYENHPVTIRDPTHPRASKFRFRDLWKKGISEILADPSRLMPRVFAIFVTVAILSSTYAVFIGIQSIIEGGFNGIGSLMLIQALLFFLTTSLGLLILGLIGQALNAEFSRRSHNLQLPPYNEGNRK